MSFLILGTAAGILGWLLFTFVRDFASAEGTLWQRLLAAADDSATKLWARVVMLIGLVPTLGISLGDFLGDTSLVDQIKAWIASAAPEYVGPFTVIVAVVTILARRRTANSS